MVAKISLFRVPQIGERILPFCVLIGAMSCFLGLSRRLELVVSRAAGMSAWQFIAPALVVALAVGVLATTIYNPIAAILQEKAKRLEAEVSGNNSEGLQATVNGFWVSQRSDAGQSIINAQGSREQGVLLSKVSASCSTRATISSSGSKPIPPPWNPATGGSTTPASIPQAHRRQERAVLSAGNQSDP